MAGEQNMQRMGGLKKFMPLTFATMMVGTLAIAGIPPLSGFFSKDEILYRTFLGGPAVTHGVALALWALAIGTALMTAFYMFRLMALTFFGAYRGAGWAAQASPAARVEAAVHGATHPRDPHAHGQANRPDHEVSHGVADVVTAAHSWHGPHESPPTMTWPLVALAAGAVVAGFVGIPQALGGSNAIEHFLEPALTSSHSAAASASGNGAAHAAAPLAVSTTTQLALMLLSVAIAAAGILAARHFYLTNPAVPSRLAERWRGLYSLLLNKYYVDELYDATVVRGTSRSAQGLWVFDNRVVDGIVNAWGSLTQIAAWFSHMLDKYVVDGLVNFVGWTAGEGSFSLRRLQTGLVQNYALMMLVGVFVFLTVYLLAR